MRTNIDIDDRLLSAAMRASGYKTKHATVEEGLRLLARKKAYGGILALRGKIHWEGDPDALRADKRG
ncbi:MAG: type II toxin-antitoxin system VapB family antitoxin [Burkholderiales bacterium]